MKWIEARRRKAQDWVALYFHSDGGGEAQRTIVGDLAENVAKRVVLLTDEF